MNFEANELLAHVDRWKLKLADQLNRMNAGQRAAFWKEQAAKAAALGLSVVEAPGRSRSASRRTRRATG